MQLVLGVAVADSVARLALVDASDPESVHDRFEVRVGGGATADLVRTIVDTDRSLNTAGYGLTATSICWPDATQATALRNALTHAGVRNVALVSAADAATAFVRAAAGRSGQDTSALLFVDDSSAALSVVGPDAATTSLIDAEELQTAGVDTACTAMMERLREEPGGAQTLYVLSTSEDAAGLTDRLRSESPIPMHNADEPTYMLARGAAVASTAATAGLPRFNTAPGPVIGDHLAYSMVDDSGSLPLGMPEEYDTGSNSLQTPMAPLPNVPPGSGYADDPREIIDDLVGGGRPRVLLLGSTIAAIVVVGFSVLAVGVAIAFKPTASQQAVRDYEAVPGKYLPPMPGQGVEPIKDAGAYLPPVVPVAAATPLEASSPTVSPGSVNTGYPGGYTSSSGPAVVAGGAPAAGSVTAPVIPGTPVVGNPQGRFRLHDWLPDLPDNVTINVGYPPGLEQCARGNVICVLRETGCLQGRPGFAKCFMQAIRLRQQTTPQVPEGCALLRVSASCAPPKPPKPFDPLNESPPVSDNNGEPGEPEKPFPPTRFGPNEDGLPRDGGAEDGTPVDRSAPDAPAVAGTTPSPETTPPSAPKPTPTTETTSPIPTTTHTTKSPTPSEPETTMPSTSTTAAPPPPVERVTTSAPVPVREEPVPAPEPVVEAPAPAPEPPPVVVEAPAPAPAPAPAAPTVSSDGPGGRSLFPPRKSRNSDSGPSDSTPVVTTEPSSP